MWLGWVEKSKSQRVEKWLTPLVVLLLISLGGCARRSPVEESLLVFAAASTEEAVTEVVRLYEAMGGGRVQVHAAASSTLARQIEAGAGADVYVSANPQWMDYLVERDLVTSESRCALLTNRLVLIQPYKVDGGDNADITILLQEFEGRLALGDPDHVPAGRYGRQALESLGLYAGIKDKILPGASVRVTLAYVERGEANLGVVYATDARISKRVMVVAELPEVGHDPIQYHAAVMKHGGGEAQSLLRFMQGSEAQAVFTSYGFGLGGGES